MSLYYVQKFLYELNRSPQLQEAYTADRRAVLEPYALSDEEAHRVLPRRGITIIRPPL